MSCLLWKGALVNKVEVAKLLTLISAIDNRKIDEVTVEMWFQILQDTDYDEAAKAVPQYFADSDVYLAPRGLLAKIKSIREAKAQSAHHLALEAEQKSYRTDPEPMCRIHNLRITKCQDCYMTIFEEADYMSANARHDWAVRNIYV